MKITEVVTESNEFNGDLKHDMDAIQLKLKSSQSHQETDVFMQEFIKTHGHEALETLVEYMLAGQPEGKPPEPVEPDWKPYNEAAYAGNIGFEEVMKFFVEAEKRDPELAQEVEDLIESNQDASAWKIIQEFLGVDLKGPTFGTTEDTINELETKDEKAKRHAVDLDALDRDSKKNKWNDKEYNSASTTRRVKLAKNKLGTSKKPVSTKPKGKEKVWDLTGENVKETATAGGTSAGNIASIANPHLSPGKARGNKSYTGSPGKSGTKSPAQPKVVQKKKADGTAKGAHEVGGSLFGGGAVKR